MAVTSSNFFIFPVTKVIGLTDMLSIVTFVSQNMAKSDRRVGKMKPILLSFLVLHFSSSK
jgi:hypothetical protein